MIFFNKRSTFVPYIRGREITAVANYAALPDPTTVADRFYWCENSQGTAWLPGSLGGTYYPRGLYYSNGTTWEYMETPVQATQAEVDAGIIDDRFVSPATLYNADQWNTVKIKLSTNGTENPDQNILNLVEGTNMTITDDGNGNITFDATGGGGGGLKSGVATAAVTDEYTTTISGVTTYNINDAYVIKFNTANSNGSTLNISGVGAVQLVKNNNVILTGGDISVGQEFIVIYDGTNFQMIGIAPNQMFAYVTNADSVTITKGQPVYAFGASGDRMSVKLANNTSEATSSKTVGLVFSNSIAPGGLGFVITQGVLSNVNTNAYSPGDTLYVGNTAGTLTNTMPTAPNHLTRIGIVERANAGNGLIYVMVQNGFQLDELSDVDITSTLPVNNDVLTYITGVDNLWKPRSISTILGYTPASYTPRVQAVISASTVTPTENDDIVVITAQAVPLTLANPTGAWVQGQPLMIRIKDDTLGARAISFDTNYRAIGITLPTTTVIGKTIYLGIIYNSTDTKWDVLGYNLQA